MKLGWFVLCGVVAGALLLAAQKSPDTSAEPSQQQARQSAAAAQPASMADANQRALEVVNTANLGEIKMGGYMEQHADNANVKRYAQELTRDHTSAENKLRSTMGRDVTSDTDPGMQQDNERELQQLQMLHGSQADDEFLQLEIGGHRKVIGELQQLEPNITNPQLKSYVESVIPTLQKHLADARKAESNH